MGPPFGCQDVGGSGRVGLAPFEPDRARKGSQAFYVMLPSSWGLAPLLFQA